MYIHSYNPCIGYLSTYDLCGHDKITFIHLGVIQREHSVRTLSVQSISASADAVFLSHHHWDIPVGHTFPLRSQFENITAMMYLKVVVNTNEI